MDVYYEVAAKLPPYLAAALGQLDAARAPFVQELRLRTGCIPTLTVRGQSLPAHRWIAAPCLCQPLTQPQLRECLLSLTDYSLQRIEEDMLQGYFTLPGGHRVGVAGRLGRRQLSVVTSLNLRVARAFCCTVPACLAACMECAEGILLIGPPGSGKTTLLRALVQALCEKGQRVSVLDERCELFGCTEEGFCHPPPQNCDVLSGVRKAEGVEWALRALGPQWLVCDELAAADAQALEHALAAGVRLAATLHGSGPLALQRLPGVARWFSCAAYLSGAEQPGLIREVEVLCGK